MDKFTKNISEFTHESNIMKKILNFCKYDKPFNYPYFAVYDFESLAINQDKRKGKNTIILKKQVPISYSIGSNIPGTQIKHVVNKDTNMLIKSLVSDMQYYCGIASTNVMNMYYVFIEKY